MDIKSYAKAAGTVINHHAPTLLTVAGGVGLFGTMVFAVRAGIKTGRTMESHLAETGEEIDHKQLAKEVWRDYIPAGTLFLATAGCVVGSNIISVRRSAALVGTISIAQNALNEYREKTREIVGNGKEQAIRDGIAEDRVYASENEANSVVILEGETSVLCYDILTGRYFRSTVEDIRRAQNDVNAECINNNYASLNEFYAAINSPELDSVPLGEMLGFTADNMLEVVFSTVLSKANKPVLAVDFRKAPIEDYYRSR